MGDGTRGWPDGAPYDAIIVTAAGPEVPTPLVDQLREGGRLIMPVGKRGGTQELVCVVRDGDGHQQKKLGGVRFVPLVGEHGFRR